MTIAEILAQLDHVAPKADFIPYENALIEAEEQREAITPELIAAINRVSDNPTLYIAKERSTLQSFAIYLLAQFREPQARDAIIRFFSLPDEISLELTGDMIPENGGRILASVCGSDFEPLHDLIRNESLGVSARRSAIDALVVQAAWQWRTREAVVEDMRQFFQTLPRSKNSELWAGLVLAVCDLCATELDREVRQTFADGLPDEVSIDLQEYEELIGDSAGWENQAEQVFPIEAVLECSEWNCFREDDDDFDPVDEADDEEMDRLLESDLPPEKLEEEVQKIHQRRLKEREAEMQALKPEPYVAPEKVGRNDPCPCGSGKKYKKCCGK